MDILIDKYIMSLYQDLEDEVIADIARRVKKTGRYTETAELMAKSMHEQGYSPAKIQAEVMKMLRADKAYQMAVAENTKAYKQEIQDIIDETVKAAKEANDTLVAEAGNMAWNNDLSMWEQHGEDLSKPNNMSQLISAARMQTMGALKNLTKTMGFRNTTLGTTGVLNAYQRELDLALIKVSTGVFSFDQAVNECVHRLAQSGLRSIDYANGRTYQIDTAVRMNVRTGMSQLAGKVMEANLQSSGQDLVITSQHMGSRPEHAPWQNKVFSYSGKSKKYPDFFKETGYGTVEGLKGANCTHDFYPFWEGASVIPEDVVEPDPVEIDGKEYTYYQATQKQRQMERNIRAIKREIEAQSRLGGPTTELNSMLKAKTNEYARFSRKAGLKVRDNRLRVEKGTSILEKKKRTIKTVKPTKPTYVFTPAKTIEEAQEYAKNFIGNGYSKIFKNVADYKGISLDNVNEVNRAIGELYSKYSMSKLNGIKAISPTSAQGKKVFSSTDAVAAYNPVEHGIFLNKDILKNANALAAYNKQSIDAWNLVMENIDNLSGSQKELALLYKNAGRSLVGDGSVYDYIVHEMGHHVQWSVLDSATNNAMGKNMAKYAPKISGYANASKGEYIAESFVAYVKGELDILDPVFVEYMKKGIVKASNDDIIKATVEYAKRNTGVLPTVYLPKNEYAHVMSEINTHMSDEQRTMPVVSKAIGDYIYTFENYGFNEYRIIGKVEIDRDKYDEIERIFDEIE